MRYLYVAKVRIEADLKMKNFDEKKAILKLIASQKEGVTKDNIVEYLDYLNKVKYSIYEIDKFLEELEKNDRVTFKDQLWYLLK